MHDPNHLQIQYKEMGMEVYWIWILHPSSYPVWESRSSGWNRVTSYKTALKHTLPPSLYLKGTGIKSMAAMTVIGIQTFLFIWLPPFQGLIAPRFYSFFLSEIFMTAGGCQTSVSSAEI